MFYATTIIRLNILSKKFENTEANNFMSKEQIEKELERLRVSDEQFHKYIEMEKYKSLTLQVETTEQIWFIYIHRIN